MKTLLRLGYLGICISIGMLIAGAIAIALIMHNAPEEDIKPGVWDPGQPTREMLV